MPEKHKQSFELMEVRGVDAEKRTVTAYASTGDMDRHGTVIEPTAFTKTMPEFMKNPVVLNAHMNWVESGEPTVVAKVIDWTIDETGLLVTIEFAETRIAGEFWQLYLKRFMRAFSVGFRVTKREMRPREDGSGEFEVYTEVELLEISCVAVPSNRESLVTRGCPGEQERGELQRETLRWLNPEARSLALDAAMELSARVEKMREAMGAQLGDLTARIAQMESDRERWRADAAGLADQVKAMDTRLAACERDIDEHLAGDGRTRETNDPPPSSSGRIAGLGF